MFDFYFNPVGRIDRRFPANEGDLLKDVILRENLLSRNGELLSVPGTNRLTTTALDGQVRWATRYATIEVGTISPKTFFYTSTGKLYLLDNATGSTTQLLDTLKTNAYPKSWMFKVGNQTILYLVDGESLYKYDGNGDNRFDKIPVLDADGKSVNPTDIIEHKDRSALLSDAYLFISKNLDFDVFDDSTDSIQAVVGSGKGKNMALGKIQDKLFIATTEGIYELRGDQLSAIAETFSIDMVEEKRLVAGRTWVKVENSLIGLYDDLEMWSFNGIQSKMLSYKECLKKSINPYREYLNKAIATYEDNYYKLSVVETGKVDCNLEFWYDTLEDKIEFIRDRNVSCYLQSDPTIELPFKLIGKSDINHISTADYGYNFDGQPIVYQLKTKSYSPRPGDNVRFDDFVLKITAKGIKQILFRYLLDTRISDLDDIAKFWEQLDGEVKFLGLIRIVNQQVFTDNIKPKIKYSKGESISFEIYGRETDLVFGMQGIGVSYTKKGSKMGKKVGQ